MQAQPSSISSSLRLKKHGSLSHSSSKSGSVVKHDSGRVGSGSGSSSSSYVCSSASSEAHVSQEVSSSSGGGSAEESLNRSTSSDGLSGSSGSKGSGSQSQKGCSGSSNGGHDADVSTVSSVAHQTPSSLESEDLGESEVIPRSESEKPLDASPGNVAGMDSSVSAEARTTLSTSVPAAASIGVIEESVPEDLEHTDVRVPVPTPHVDPGVQSERVHSSSLLSSPSVSSQPLDSHTANQQSVSREKPFEPHPSEQGEKQLEEPFVAGVDQQTSSELLPEIPGSPELLQTVCREEEELMEDSPEIDFQAPVSMPPPGHAPQEHISSSTPDQSHRQTSIALPLLAASSSGRDTAGEPMEGHEVSTQNSFALHWSQSQTSALTPSGILSQYKPGEPNDSQASLKLGSISYEGLEEIKDHEREFPNLEDQDHQQQQSLERSVSEEGISGSQKTSDRSETSLTSSSSQSVKSGSGPDSTPPEDGGGGGGDMGGGGGDMGGGGGVGGSMGGSGEDEERKGSGTGDKGREQREKEAGRKESNKTCQDEKSAESELKTVATATSHTHIRAPSEPPSTVIRARPVPTYESLQCEGSAEEVVVNHHEELPSVQSAPTPALIGEAGQWCGQEGGQGGVNSQVIRPPTAESQHSLELTPSGT